MAVTEQGIDQFQQFAKSKLADGEEELTWPKLFQSWLVEYTSSEERQEVNAIIRQGIADIDAGRSIPVDEVHDQLRAKYSID